MNPVDNVLGLVPWLVFGLVTVVAGAGGVAQAAAVAALLSAALAARSRRRGASPALIEDVGAVTFAAVTVLAFAAGDAAREDIALYGRGCTGLVLAGAMLVSVMTVPFTEPIARQRLHRRYWDSPVFRAINQRLSAFWSVLVAVLAIAHLVAGALRARAHEASLTVDVAGLVLDWVLPVALVLWGLRRSERLIADGLHPRSPLA